MPSTSHPYVSVIIPVYGVEAFIQAAVQSVLDQTYSDFEVLIIDDASPDRSVELCQQFVDPRIHIIHQENRGLAGARNTGIRHAKGTYLAFLDGDDLWLPQKLEKQVQHLDANPAIGVSFSRSALIDETGAAMGTYLLPPLSDLTVRDFLRGNPVGNGSAPVVRRVVFEAIRFEVDRNGVPEDQYFDEQFRRAEDVECWLRILIQTDWQIAGITDTLTLYRVNSTGLSASLYQQLESLEQVLAKVRAYAPEQIAPWEKQSLAYLMQILARTAIRLRAGAIAVDLSHRAIKTYWRIVLEQPRRILPTIVVAYLLRLLPQSLYQRVSSLVEQVAALNHKRQIHHQAPATSALNQS